MLPLAESQHIEKLVHLDVSSNKLLAIEEEVQAKLNNLESLDVAFNEFPIFPVIKGYMPQLRKINIVGNPLTIMPETFFSGDQNRSVITEWAFFERDSSDLLKFEGTLSLFKKGSRTLIQAY